MADEHDRPAGPSGPPATPPSGEDVGYCRPPRHSQFKKGQSGNPKGRRKGSKNLSTLIEEELSQPIVVTENGTRKRISKKLAVAKRVANGAVAGDPKMVNLVLGQAQGKEVSQATSPLPELPLTAEDDLVIQSIIARIRAATPVAAASATGTTPSDTESPPARAARQHPEGISP